ncbi:hypothetical protein [Candidatus Electrothrix sp.]|uniref:hypothetical protein n=1 Tax=Candidatus Electrothrix sp. TaxID=2170559 RepID=UPI004056DA0B
MKDDEEAPGKIFFCAGADGAAGDKAKPCPLLINDAVAGNPGAGINADNPYRLALPIKRPEIVYDRASMISSGMSKLA